MRLFQMIRYEARNIRSLLYNRIYVAPETQLQIVNGFHKLYYELGQHIGTWTQTYWLGTPVRKCPLDLWIYQEILFNLKPDFIIESGTFKGGSALFLASVCELIGHGSVITIDTEEHKNRPTHPRIQYLHGSSTSPEIIQEVRQTVRSATCVLVILDSDHSQRHVMDELNVYKDMVTIGSFLIVEDTNINGHPVERNYGPGPREAVDEFIKNHKNFSVDATKEKFILTFNPYGYLRRDS